MLKELQRDKMKSHLEAAEGKEGGRGAEYTKGGTGDSRGGEQQRE